MIQEGLFIEGQISKTKTNKTKNDNSVRKNRSKTAQNQISQSNIKNATINPNFFKPDTKISLASDLLNQQDQSVTTLNEKVKNNSDLNIDQRLVVNPIHNINYNSTNKNSSRVSSVLENVLRDLMPTSYNNVISQTKNQPRDYKDVYNEFDKNSISFSQTNELLKSEHSYENHISSVFPNLTNTEKDLLISIEYIITKLTQISQKKSENDSILISNVPSFQSSNANGQTDLNNPVVSNFNKD